MLKYLLITPLLFFSVTAETQVHPDLNQPNIDIVTTTQAIKQHIERHWLRPPGISNIEQLKARVKLTLKRDGTIKSLRIVKSSGHQFYDNSILRAVRKAIPLPIPSDKYEKFKLLDLYFSG